MGEFVGSGGDGLLLVEECGRDAHAPLLDDLPDRKVKFGSKLEVTGIVTRHSHDGTCSVAHHDVVGNPHRDLLAVDGVGSRGPGEDTGLVFV